MPKLGVSISPTAEAVTPLYPKRGALNTIAYFYMKDKMTSKRIHNKKELIEFRKELRSNLTPAEAFLWKHLKAKQLDNKKFVKQHSIGNYIVDFYCAPERLIIELDGQVHLNPTAEEYDERRTDFLNSLGYKVLRVENKMVFDNLESVLMEIKENFK